MSLETDIADGRGAVDVMMTVFVRALSMLLIYRGLAAWSGLIGIDPFGGTPFVDQSIERQVYTVILSVLAPVAAVGLWLEASWGPVLWLIIAIAEMIMHIFFTQVFGLAPLVVAMHAILIIVFAAIYILVARTAAKERQRKKKRTPESF